MKYILCFMLVINTFLGSGFMMDFGLASPLPNLKYIDKIDGADTVVVGKVENIVDMGINKKQITLGVEYVIKGESVPNTLSFSMPALYESTLNSQSSNKYIILIKEGHLYVPKSRTTFSSIIPLIENKKTPSIYFEGKGDYITLTINELKKLILHNYGYEIKKVEKEMISPNVLWYKYMYFIVGILGVLFLIWCSYQAMKGRKNATPSQ